MIAAMRARANWLAHFGKALLQQHHRELIPTLAPFIKPDATVFDVGAHAGQFAKLFSGLAPNGHVYAFEPGSYARSILDRVVRYRRIKNCTILPIGLSDTETEMTLQVPVKRQGSLGFGLSHFGPPQKGRDVRAESVRVTTIDNLIGELNLTRLDFIKSDIEGWEIRMLRGAMIAVARFRPVIMLELVGASAARAQALPAEAWDMLLPLGYKARRLESTELCDRFAGDGDYIFMP